LKFRGFGSLPEIKTCSRSKAEFQAAFKSRNRVILALAGEVSPKNGMELAELALM
jgi:hypothetical protein